MAGNRLELMGKPRLKINVAIEARQQVTRIAQPAQLDVAVVAGRPPDVAAVVRRADLSAAAAVM